MIATSFVSSALMLEMFNENNILIASIADKIFMMENGRIIESGNHNELMALGGKYKEMFDLQAEKYLKGDLN